MGSKHTNTDTGRILVRRSRSTQRFTCTYRLDLRGFSIGPMVVDITDGGKAMTVSALVGAS